MLPGVDPVIPEQAELELENEGVPAAAPAAGTPLDPLLMAAAQLSLPASDPDSSALSMLLHGESMVPRPAAAAPRGQIAKPAGLAKAAVNPFANSGAARASRPQHLSRAASAPSGLAAAAAAPVPVPVVDSVLADTRMKMSKGGRTPPVPMRLGLGGGLAGSPETAAGGQSSGICPDSETPFGRPEMAAGEPFSPFCPDSCAPSGAAEVAEGVPSSEPGLLEELPAPSLAVAASLGEPLGSVPEAEILQRGLGSPEPATVVSAGPSHSEPEAAAGNGMGTPQELTADAEEAQPGVPDPEAAEAVEDGLSGLADAEEVVHEEPRRSLRIGGVAISAAGHSEETAAAPRMPGRKSLRSAGGPSGIVPASGGPWEAGPAEAAEIATRDASEQPGFEIGEGGPEGAEAGKIDEDVEPGPAGGKSSGPICSGVRQLPPRERGKGGNKWWDSNAAGTLERKPALHAAPLNPPRTSARQQQSRAEAAPPCPSSKRHPPRDPRYKNPFYVRGSLKEKEGFRGFSPASPERIIREKRKASQMALEKKGEENGNVSDAHSPRPVRSGPSSAAASSALRGTVGEASGRERTHQAGPDGPKTQRALQSGGGAAVTASPDHGPVDPCSLPGQAARGLRSSGPAADGQREHTAGTGTGGGRALGRKGAERQVLPVVAPAVAGAPEDVSAGVGGGDDSERQPQASPVNALAAAAPAAEGDGPDEGLSEGASEEVFEREASPPRARASPYGELMAVTCF